MASKTSDGTDLVVAAIDIGSHGSGYAFSFRHEFITNPININTPYWSSDTGGGISYKTPSSILFDSEKKFVAFGHEAEDKYLAICEKNEQNIFYFLNEFKMKLYQAVLNEQDIRDDFDMNESNGKQISAKLVFTMAITFLRNHLLEQFKERNTGVDADNIRWVITVPAIWNDACKQFMKEAGKGAGIKEYKFSIVYEPEAASVYARLLSADRFIGQNQTAILKTFDQGNRFIVIDAGGGTVDISTQEVLCNGHLKIIHKVCGGSWGGELINQEYRDFLKRLLGGDVLKEYKQNHGLDYNEMMRHFETTKKSFKLTDYSTVATRFPGSLSDFLESRIEYTISDIIENSSFKGKTRVKRDKLFISRDIFESFYKESISMTIKDIKEVLKNDRCTSVSAIILVGGFSQCQFLQTSLRHALDLDVFIPEEGGLSVMKGAVIYGHDPTIISSRVCNYTYGVSISVPFNRSIHPSDKYYRWDKENWCKHVFHVCYEADQDVRVGDVELIQINNTFESIDARISRTKPFTVEIYISEQKKPTFVTDEGCQLHAKIHVDPPNGIWPVYAFGWVELEVAGTEMIGTYVNADSGERISTRFEFLPTGYKSLSGERERMNKLDSW